MQMPVGTPPADQTSGRTNDMALASLLGGATTWLVGWMGGWVLGLFLPGLNLCAGFVGFIAAIVGVIAGHRGLAQTRPGSLVANSRWMAVMGLGLSYASLALIAAATCLLIGLFLIFGATIFTSADWSQLPSLLSSTPGP